jgi:hypothetical protein
MASVLPSNQPFVTRPILSYSESCVRLAMRVTVWSCQMLEKVGWVQR